MTFVFTLKYNRKPLKDFEIPFNGTRQEAFTRARNLAVGVYGVFGDRKFKVRVDRIDRAATGYEIGWDGHEA